MTNHPGGRLSVVSGDPCHEADTISSSLYLVSLDSDGTSLWDGTGWVDILYPGELSLTLTAAAHLAGKNYDVFEFIDAGVVKIGTGPAWSSNTLRGSAIEVLGGRLVNAAAITCINNGVSYNVPAGQGNLRGGFRAFANGQTRSTKQSRLVWDLFRPTVMPVAVIDTADTWSYAGAAFRQANGNPANQIEVFNGVSGRPVDVTVWGYMIGTTSTPVSGFVGVGLDTSVADSAQVKVPCAGANTFPVLPGWARFAGFVGIGYHELRWIERGNGGAAQTWVGDNGYGGYGYQSGLIGQVVL